MQRRPVLTDERGADAGGYADTQARRGRRRPAGADEHGAGPSVADLHQGEPAGQAGWPVRPARRRQGGAGETGEGGGDRRLGGRHRWGRDGGQPVRRRQQRLRAGVLAGDRRVARRRAQPARPLGVARAQRRGPFQRGGRGGVAGPSARPDRHVLQGACEVLRTVDGAGW
ncbi:hypothetical protein GCM10020358_60060 [Amorphoplanes nipponensis]